MKNKFKFGGLLIAALLISIFCGATLVNSQDTDIPCGSKTRAGRRIARSITNRIKRLKAENPGKHIDIEVVVGKKTITIIRGKTSRVFVNKITRYAKTFGYVTKVVDTDPTCNTGDCTTNTKPCGQMCIPCTCKCAPQK